MIQVISSVVQQSPAQWDVLCNCMYHQVRQVRRWSLQDCSYHHKNFRTLQECQYCRHLGHTIQTYRYLRLLHQHMYNPWR